MTILIGITDDHSSFLQSMSLLIRSFSYMQVILQANDGQDLLTQLSHAAVKPQIILIDVNMPVLDGPETMEQLGRDYPDIRILAMSMHPEEMALIRMMRAGCRGWWLKYSPPEEMEQAIAELYQNGYYNADPLNVYHRRQPDYSEHGQLPLTAAERSLLQLCCSDLTTDEIDERLDLPDESKHALYHTLYEKLHVRSRLGAALEGFRKGMEG